MPPSAFTLGRIPPHDMEGIKSKPHRSKRLIQIADDVSQGGGGEVLDGQHGLLDAVGVELGVGNLHVDYGVNLHRYIVFCDDRLGRKVQNFFFERDVICNPVQKRKRESLWLELLSIALPS